MNDKDELVISLKDVVNFVALIATSEEAHEAFTAAWLYCKEGKETKLCGVSEALYCRLVALINEAREGEANE